MPECGQSPGKKQIKGVHFLHARIRSSVFPALGLGRTRRHAFEATNVTSGIAVEDGAIKVEQGLSAPLLNRIFFNLHYS